MSKLTEFATEYLKTVSERDAMGIPPLPLDEKQTAALCELLQEKGHDPKALVLEGLDHMYLFGIIGRRTRPVRGTKL